MTSYSEEFYYGYDIVVGRPVKPTLSGAHKSSSNYRDFADLLEEYEKKQELYVYDISNKNKVVDERQQSFHDLITKENDLSPVQFKLLWETYYVRDHESLSEKIMSLAYLAEICTKFSKV